MEARGVKMLSALFSAFFYNRRFRKGIKAQSAFCITVFPYHYRPICGWRTL